MITTPIQDRRKAAQAIEQAIERQLNLLQIPVPEHSWCVDERYSQVMMTYQVPEHGKFEVSFTGAELDVYETDPKFTTLSKIASLASELLKVHKAPRD